MLDLVRRRQELEWKTQMVFYKRFQSLVEIFALEVGASLEQARIFLSPWQLHKTLFRKFLMYHVCGK